MNVALVDYGAGNAPSVERALQKLGATPIRAKTPGGIESAQAIILPGVGHFAALIRALDEYGLRESLLSAIQRGVPFLGICLGLQALFEGSEEAPELAGLSVFPGRVHSLPATAKLPHMGWNRIKTTKESRLLRGISESDFFYFAHSFAAQPANGASAATCSYSAEFLAALEKENICAVQFHPEKSGQSGARVLQNFLEMARQ